MTFREHDGRVDFGAKNRESPSGQNTRTPSGSEVYTFPGSTPTSKIGKTHEYFDLTASAIKCW